MKTKYLSGQQMRAARDSLGLSRKAVILSMAKLGRETTEKTLGQWEAGISEPDGSDVFALADVLGHPIEHPFFCPDGCPVASTQATAEAAA